MVQDLRDLALACGEFARHAVLQQCYALAQRGQRRLEFVGHVAQETRLVGIQLQQPQPQPFQLLAQSAHVVRAGDQHRLVQLVFAQLSDRALQPLERPREPDAQRQRQHQRQHNRAHHLVRHAAAALLHLVLQRVVALGVEVLHRLHHGAVQGLQGHKLFGNQAFVVQSAVRRCVQQGFDGIEVGAPRPGLRSGQACGLQMVEHREGLDRHVVEAAAQGGIPQHQGLPR